MSKGALPVPYFLASTCRRGGRVRRIGTDVTQSIGEGVGGNANDRFRLSCQVSTSLTYIVLLTRGCPPWIHAAVMGTTWGECLHSSPGFSRAGQCNTRRCSRHIALRGLRYLYPIQSGSGKPAPYKLKKRQLFPGLRPASPGSIASQLWPPTGGELRLQVREYWPDSLLVHYLDSGYFKTYIYLNTTYVCNSSAWFKLTIKLENGGHFEFSTPVNCKNLLIILQIDSQYLKTYVKTLYLCF